ncbi:MAG: phage tail tube protein [Candidatus Sphingomonas colombiensis]|nr:phage tail tube protein [Sphingomonas sp.]WEK42982.1 MAG: phage tail tube protein [Sphingomonas sp.]
MSAPKIIKGQYFDVAVFDPNNPGKPTILCGLTSRNFTHQFNTNDEFIRDCQDPSAVPFRVVNVTGEQFDISGTGLFNRAQGDLLRRIAGRSMKYHFIMSEDAEDPVDGGFYEGNFVCSNIQYGAQDGANVTIQTTFVSDGQVLWYPAPPEDVLDPLSVSPLVAVKSVAWTGTVAGATTGSTITATSSDSTALTVTGTSIAGTFATAGNKTLTITETLVGATNSPKITKIGINVSAA